MQKNHHHIILILLVFCFGGYYGACQQKQGTIKLLSYNIWNGYDFGKDEKRRAELVAWINTENPSIVGLQELVNYTPEKLMEDAKNWGHNHSILLKENGYSVGLTSEYPIELKEKIFDGMHHGALHCKTGGLDIFVIHFSPSSYKKRLEEANIILKKLDKVTEHNPNYIVMGDFNAHSPMDADLYKNNILLNRLRSFKKNQGQQGNLAYNELDYGVISRFLAYPLVDTCLKFTNGISERGSFPGRVLAKVNSESEKDLVKRLERIDFIFVSPQLGQKLNHAVVFNKQPNWYLSDHYPVGIELLMNP